MDNLKKFIVLLLTVLFAFTGCGRRIATGPDRYMGVGGIKTGMKGFGRTVFKGDTVESFDVEIIGVLHNWSPDGDMIIAELHHPVTDEAKGIAGMSGSPVYIKGRMIGAVAYGWRFQTRTLMGITPIAQMRIGDAKPAMKTASLMREDGIISAEAQETYDLQPLSIPFMVSGASPRFREFLQKKLSEKLHTGIQIGSGGKAGGGAGLQIRDIQEGSAIAVKLIEGDLDIAAVGTVTCIEGDTVYAFGHPFNMDGGIELPMAKAWVHTVISSMSRSFKLSSTGETIGTFTYDFAHAIMGKKGRIPCMVEVESRIENLDTGETAEHNFKVVHDKNWTGFLTLLSLYNSIGRSSIVGTEVSAWITSEIQAEGIPSVAGKDFYFTYGSPGFGAAYPVWFKIDTLMENDIKAVDIQKVKMSVKVKSGRHMKSISRYLVDRREVKPGDTVEVTLFLKEYQKDPYPEKISIHIPEDIPEGRVTLRLYNGLGASFMDMNRAPGLGSTRDISRVAELMSDRYGANTLLVEFDLPEPGLTVEGVEFENLPESVMSIYRDLYDRRISSTGYKLYKRTALERDDVVMGSISIGLTVSKYND